MTFDEYIASLGYRQMEDGRFMAPDGESVLDADQLQQMFGASYQAATASASQPLYGTGGKTDGIAVEGTPYQQIGPWANNSADPATALQMEISHLQSAGVEPTYDPQYGWIAPDVSVDPRVAAAHPEQNSDSIFDFGPIILGGGLAALAAGVGGLGAAAVASGSPAAVVAPAASLPSASTIMAGAGKGALTGAITTGLQGGNPLTGALTGAVTGGAGSAAAPFVSGLTSSPAVNQALGSAGLGALASGMRGGDPLAGAVNAGVNSGINSAGSALWNMVTNPAPNPIATGSQSYDQPTAVSSASTEQPAGDNTMSWIDELFGNYNGGSAIDDLAGYDPYAGLDMNASAGNWWDNLTSEFGNAGEVANVPPALSDANRLGLEQMAASIGLTGPAAQQFVANGGMANTAALSGLPGYAPPGTVPVSAFGAIPGSAAQGGAGGSATGWNGNIYINNAPPPSQNKSGLPDWLNELLPNATAGSLLGGLFQAGLGVAGSNAQAEALQNLTNQQAGNFAQGTQAYYDAVNRQTGAYGDATGAYKERNAAQQKAYEDQVGQYKSLLDLQKGAYGDQKSAYDANFAAQQKAYQDQTGQYGALLDLQKGAYGTSMDAYNANVAAQQKAYQDQQAAYGNVLDLQKGAYGDQKAAYNANVEAQNRAYQDQRGDYVNLLGLQQGAYGDQKAAYDANVAAQKASYDTSLGLFGQQNQQQMAAYGDRTAQYNAERARQTALGQPYRDTLAGLYADPSSFLTSKEVQVPVQQASDIMARSLSTKGNPFGSGNALQQLQSYSADQLFGKLGEEKNRLGTLGGLTGAAYQGPASPQGPAVMQAFPNLQNQGPLSTPNYSQNFPTFTSPGNMPAPNYSQNFPTFTSAGQAPTPNFSQNFPTFSSPGQLPGANYSQNFPQLGTPGNFPTMPNPPQFPNQDWGAATALAGNTANTWNSIGSGISSAVNPPTTLAQLLAQMKITS